MIAVRREKTNARTTPTTTPPATSQTKVPVAWSGSRRTGDVVWVTFKVPSVRQLRGVKIASTLLFEVYDDQVNIVQTTAEGRHRSMLFTTGDGRVFKSLE